jgi:hypothetical protein
MSVTIILPPSLITINLIFSPGLMLVNKVLSLAVNTMVMLGMSKCFMAASVIASSKYSGRQRKGGKG